MSHLLEPFQLLEILSHFCVINLNLLCSFLVYTSLFSFSIWQAQKPLSQVSLASIDCLGPYPLKITSPRIQKSSYHFQRKHITGDLISSFLPTIHNDAFWKVDLLYCYHMEKKKKNHFGMWSTTSCSLSVCYFSCQLHLIKLRKRERKFHANFISESVFEYAHIMRGALSSSKTSACR